MSTIPLPLPQYYPRHQEDLYWYKFESDGALGRKSIQGAIQARLEGSSGSYGQVDFEDNTSLHQAMEAAIATPGFRAASRIKRIDRALKHLDVNLEGWKHNHCKPIDVLSAIYFTPPQRGLEAFEAFANLAVFSLLAKRKFKSSKSKQTFEEWLTILSQRRVGYLDTKTNQRHKPKATNGEIATCIGIVRECQFLLRDALWQYVKATHRIRELT